MQGNGESGRLLIDLAENLGCEYLSDLRYTIPAGKLREEVEQIPLESYSELDWIDAASYLTDCERCKSAKEARLVLLNLGDEHAPGMED